MEWDMGSVLASGSLHGALFSYLFGLKLMDCTLVNYS